MTKKPEQPVSGESEAIRQLMISLYGGETEARQVAAALLRNITSEEEELLQRRYDRADEIARQIALEHVSLAGPDALSNASSDFEPLSEQEEKELLSFMEAVYRRIETAEGSPTESDNNSAGPNVHKLPEKHRAGHGPQGQSRDNWRLRAAASGGRLDADLGGHTNDRGPDRLETINLPQGQITFWDGGKVTYVSFAEGADKTTLEFGSEKRAYMLKRCTDYPGLFEVVGLTPADADDFTFSHLHEPDLFPITWR